MKYPLLIDALIKTAKDRPADQENLVQSKMFVKVSLVVDHSLRFANNDVNFSQILTFSNLNFYIYVSIYYEKLMQQSRTRREKQDFLKSTKNLIQNQRFLSMENNSKSQIF